MVSTRGVKFQFSEGERVLCYEPDTTKARVLYDSKVLELHVNRDNRGRKVPEYLIHFYGWSNSWDRCVTEDLILPDTEENRNLQLQLSTNAVLTLKNRRKGKIVVAAKDAAKNEPPEEVKSLSSMKNRRKGKMPVATKVAVKRGPPVPVKETPAAAKVQIPSCSNSASESSDEEFRRKLKIEIPDPLKRLLEQDCIQIVKKNKVGMLPCELNVVDILEGYMRHFTDELIYLTEQKKTKNEKQLTIQNMVDKIHICQEIMDGLRIYFDFTLPHILLYGEEKKHHYTVGNTCAPFSKFKSEKMEQQTGAGSIEGSITPPKSSGRAQASGLKSPSSEDNSLTQKNLDKAQQKTRRFKSLRSRRGLRSSDKSKSSEEDETPVAANNSSVSGQDSDHSPTRPESPSMPTNILRQTRHSSQHASAAAKRGPNVTASTSSASQQPLSIDILAANHPFDRPAASPSPSTSLVSITEKLTSPNAHIQIRNEVYAWRMVPPQYYAKVPAAPSLIYGGQHLLRLFVRLPELLSKTQMTQKKLEVLLNGFEGLLQYLINKKDELFIPCYVDNCKELCG